MGYKTKRARACDISEDVRRIVAERDGGLCVICHRVGSPNAHYIARSHGGLGIPQNIVTLCPACHDAFDNGMYRRQFGDAIRAYLEGKYPDFDTTQLTYRKGSI